ncbi:hypothetical protein V8C26DRAFT_21523 [Trichoderma gracile]
MAASSCRDTASEPKSPGCHPTKVLRFSSVGWPHEMAAANSLQCYPQRGWTKAGRRCAGALEQARSCLAYQKRAGLPWELSSRDQSIRRTAGEPSWPWRGLLCTASVPVMKPSGCCYGSGAVQV